MVNLSLMIDHIIQEKWGEALDAGFQVIPNILFWEQTSLKLDAVDVVILLNLTSHWWESKDRPFITPSTIATRMNISRRTVERRIKRLEEKLHLLRRERINISDGEATSMRAYNLLPLAEVLKERSLNSLKVKVKNKAKKSKSF
jgi:hypothetical protein